MGDSKRLDNLRPGDHINGDLVLSIEPGSTKPQIVYELQCSCGYVRKVKRTSLLTKLRGSSKHCKMCSFLQRSSTRTDVEVSEINSTAELYNRLSHLWAPSPRAIACVKSKARSRGLI